MAFFGLKLGLDLEMRAAHPGTKNSKKYPPPGQRVNKVDVETALQGLNTSKSDGWDGKNWRK